MKNNIKSIRMTDDEYEFIKSRAKESNMSIGTYLVKIAHNNNLGMNPAIMCKLIAIRNYLNEPELQPLNYDETLKKEIDDLCSIILK